MRLEQGQGLPKQLRFLVVAHLVLVLLLVIISVGIWVPTGEQRLLITRFFNGLTGLYVLSMCSIYFSAARQNQVQDGTQKALGLPLILAFIAQFFPNISGLLLLWLANGWLMLLEATPTHKSRWPVPWQTARRQQGVLLLVALTSTLVAVYTRGYVYG